MELSCFFKAVVDSDNTSVVICDITHTIIYMNPAAVSSYAKRGGAALIGRSIFDCHNDVSNKRITEVVEWFAASPENNRLFTFHNPKLNKDVYMIALRDDSSRLIGYYEKHEFRNAEAAQPYKLS